MFIHTAIRTYRQFSASLDLLYPFYLIGRTMNTADSLRMLHLNDHMFSKIANTMGLKLLSWHPVDMNIGTSIVNRIVHSKGREGVNAGNLAFDIHLLADCEDGRKTITKKVILRIKASGEITISALVEAISKLSLQEAKEVATALQYVNKSELRDVLLAKAATHDPVLQAIMPTVYYVELDWERKFSFFVMDRFDSAMCSHIECIEGGEGFDKQTWSQMDIQCALKDIATVHAKFLGNLELLPYNLKEYLADGVEIFHSSSKYMKVGSTNNNKLYPDMCSSYVTKVVHRIAENIDIIVKEFNASPKTLIHHDFNPRNACLRLGHDTGSKSLCLYDWELAATHVPQVDVAEFLIFSLPVKGAFEAMSSLAEFYRQCLVKELDKVGSHDEFVYRVVDPIVFRKLFDYSVMERLSWRLMLYCSAVNAVGFNMPYLARCINVAAEYLQCVTKRHTFLNE